MLLGQTPFKADTPSATLMAHLHQPVPRPRDLDPGLDAGVEPVLLKALAKDPDDRYGSAGDLHQALALALPEHDAPADTGQPTIAGQPVTGPPTADQGRQAPSSTGLAPGQISLDQARVLAIRHARENTDFYGEGYAGSNFVWEVISEEDTGNYYEIRLGYRPSGRFRGEPGVEQFTIGKSGSIELRQILDEPSALSDETEKKGLPTRWLLAAAGGIAAVAGVGTVALISLTGGEDRAAPGDLAAPGPAEAGAPPASVASPATVGPTPAAPGARPARAAPVPVQPLSPDIGARLESIFQKASEIRGLEPIKEIVPNYVDSDEIRKLGMMQLEKDREVIEADQAMGSIIGLIPPDIDLVQLAADISAESRVEDRSVVAYYDDEAKEIYINGDLAEPKPDQEYQIVYWYTRALLDQHFDAGRLVQEARARGDWEAGSALGLLIGGDAERVAREYFSSHIAPERLMGGPPGQETPIFDGAPDFAKRMFTAGAAGYAFVRSLIQSGGLTTFNLVYSNPPSSSAQIYYPEKYLAGEAPVDVGLPDLVAALGPGWAEIHSRALGVARLRVFLAEVAGADYTEIARGWTGDRYAILEGPDGARALALLVEWSSAEAAGGFYGAITPNFKSAETFLGVDDNRVLLVIGPDQQVVSTIKEQFPSLAGASPASSRVALPAVKPISADLDTRLKAIFRAVSEIRGLEPLEEVVLKLVPGERFEELAAKQVPRERVERDQALLETLGLVPKGLDMYQLWVDVWLEVMDPAGHPAAFYDLDAGELNIAADLSGPSVFQELMIATYYVFALQQQHFDFRAMREPLEGRHDAWLALTALGQGDSFLAAQHYGMTHISPDRLQRDNPLEIETPVLDSAPDVVKRRTSMSLTGGMLFAGALLESGGWAAVDRAFKNPPASTEHILHPSKYLAGETPVEVALPQIAKALGSTWAVFDTATMGELMLRAYLAHLTGQEQAKAAAGWGGDRFILLESPLGERALAALIVWDSQKDAQEFYEIVAANTDISDNIYVGVSGDRVLLIIAPFEAAMTKIREQFPGF